MKKLAQRCYQALRNSEYWTNRSKENGRTIANLICPECGDKTAWANQDEPYSINCNKSNTCGARTKTRELFNITMDIEREYQATQSDPHRPAREYLKSRGISDETLKGLDFRYWKRTRKGLKTGAVMFPLGKDKNGRACYNGRLLNPPAGEGKTHNSGSTSGKYWSHPAIPLSPSRPVAITEGIIDALSLIQMGSQAIAVLSSGQDPTKLEGLDQYQLICAFDNDQAGLLATKNYLEAYPNAKAIMPNHAAQDWNDILQANPRTAAERFKENEGRYLQNAELALANSAHEYGRLHLKYFDKAPGLFVFNGCTYYGEMRTKGEEPSVRVERVGKFTIELLSKVNIGTAQQREYLYHLRVKPQKGRPVECVATGRNLSTARDFGAFLLSHAGVNFEGKSNAMTALGTRIVTTKVAEVKKAKYTGYCPQSGWYIFANHAVDLQGRIHLKDNAGIFKAGHSERILPAPQAKEKAIIPLSNANIDTKDIYKLIRDAWGENGATAFAWTIAGWFVHAIKAKENFFPMLSLHGDPAAGKSALAIKLQAIQGRDTEGLPISQLNTKKGLARSMAGLSGLFTALLEDNDRNERAFDYSMLLTLYNTASLQVQAKFTNTLEVEENQFLSSLLFVQNSEPFIKKQEKQRVISLHFETKDLTSQTRLAFSTLNNLPKEELATVMIAVLKHRQFIEQNWQKEFQVACADLELVQEERIRNNHALILAFHRLFCGLFDIESDIYNHIEETALLKERTSAALELNEASLFFEQVFSSTSEQRGKYWHEIETPSGVTTVDYNSLYFSLTELIRLLQNEGLQPPRAKELQEALKKHPAYLRHGVNHRFPSPAVDNKQGPISVQRKAWKFDLVKFREIEEPPGWPSETDF